MVSDSDKSDPTSEAADTILIVESRGDDIIASLYGPAGRLIMRFHEISDAGFAALWRHWIHPRPNFDLLIQFVRPRRPDPLRP